MMIGRLNSGALCVCQGMARSDEQMKTQDYKDIIPL